MDGVVGRRAGSRRVQLSHAFPVRSVVFDDPNLVSHTDHPEVGIERRSDLHSGRAAVIARVAELVGCRPDPPVSTPRSAAPDRSASAAHNSLRSRYCCSSDGQKEAKNG